MENQELQQEQKQETISAEGRDNAETERRDTPEQSEVLTPEEEAKREIARLMKENKDKDDSYLRMMAEFDNFRKRSFKEKEGMREKGEADVVEALLPILDDFDRAFAHVTEEKDEIFAGMRMVYKNLLNTLENLGLKEIDALGKEFDHDYHNAISHEENPELGENVVAEVYQKGYLYKDKVIRFSVVKVAN